MTITKEQRVPRGRPKIFDFKTKQEYFRYYYKNNRDKWNHDFFCDTCELYSSFANKSRHNKSKFHLDKLAAKKKASETKDAHEEKGSEEKGSDNRPEEKGSEEKLEIKLELLFSEDILA